MLNPREAGSGAIEGTMWGLAFFGLEEVFSYALSQPGLTLGEVSRLMPAYLLLPAAVGALSGAFGKIGLLRSWIIWAGMSAFLLGGKFAHILSEKALPGALGFPVAALGIGVGVAVGWRLTKRLPSLRWGGLIAVWLLSVGGLTVNLGALASPVSKEALIWDGSIAGVAALIGWMTAKYAEPNPLRAATGLALISWALRGPVAISQHQALPEASTHSAPPIVLIVVDTLRADGLGIYGNPRSTSPNIDAMARESLVYTQANSSSSWTLPATASLLTGRNPSRHGAGANLGTGNSNHGLNGDVPTVAELLGEAGYTTAGIVTNPWLKRLYGLGRGFDYYDDALGLGHNPLALQPLDQLGFSVMQTRYYTPAERQVDKALRFVESQGEQGWFLFLHLMDPHGPYLAPERHLRGSEEDFEDPVEWLYEAEVRYTDEQLKRLFDALPDNAWILLTSDHGEEFGEHPGAYADQPIPPNTRHGHTLYQEVVHVPLIVRAPGRGSLQRIDAPVGTVDVAETLARIGGSTWGSDHDSGVLAEVFWEEREAPREVLSEAIRYGIERKALRVSNNKLIHTATETELYDLDADPMEVNNHAQRSPDTVGALVGALPQYETVTGSAAEASQTDQARLNALGYVD